MADSHPTGAPLEQREEQLESESETEEQPQDGTEGAQDQATSTASKQKKKKKKSKKSKIVSALTGNKSSEPAESSSSQPASKLSNDHIKQLLEMNPTLKGELAGMPTEKAAEALRKMDLQELLSGMSLNGKNQKDMASYKFWATQPVPRFDERPEAEKPDGPIKEVIPELVPKTAAPLPEGYEWVELDLSNDAEVKEVYNLLSLHYVEDDHAMFRSSTGR